MEARDPTNSLDGSGGREVVLRLYVAGAAPNSIRAVENLTVLCRLHLAERCTLEIVDVLKDPLRALTDDILVTPTLLKLAPGQKVRIIGDLSDEMRVLAVLSEGNRP